ncbi:HNH endonuclease [Haliangium sp.]|uniref:HNH endonuclease n=1 Tax=Haliangium sp. TaxID=2663208 RepID=UPI003D132857
MSYLRNHPRYGNLEAIARRTGHRCHLCHEPIDLAFYGAPGTYGDDTVTVDHLEPQSWGGDDDPDNLRIAHARCNSVRGVREPEDVRLEFVGAEDEPMSSLEHLLSSAVGAAGIGAAAGMLFGRVDRTGQRQFNRGAAAIAGLLSFALLQDLVG